MVDGSRRAHKEVLVKVNAFVDEGISPVVTALNSFTGVVTLDSCQCDASGEGYVSFQFGNGWCELGKFVGRLSVAIGKRLDLCCGFALRLEWFAGGEEPLAQVRVSPEHIQPLATAIQAVAEKGL